MVATVRSNVAKLNLEIDQGSTFDLTLTVTAPADLTGYSARMQMRDSHASATPFYDVTDADPDLTLGTVPPTIRLLISDETSEAITRTTAVYDLEIESPAGVSTRVIEGRVKFTPEVTRS